MNGRNCSRYILSVAATCGFGLCCAGAQTIPLGPSHDDPNRINIAWAEHLKDGIALSGKASTSYISRSDVSQQGFWKVKATSADVDMSDDSAKLFLDEYWMPWLARSDSRETGPLGPVPWNPFPVIVTPFAPYGPTRSPHTGPYAPWWNPVYPNYQDYRQSWSLRKAFLVKPFYDNELKFEVNR